MPDSSVSRTERSGSVGDYPVGTVVEWEASAYGSRFIGPVRRHICYAGRDALDVVNGRGSAVVYPEFVLRKVDPDA